MTFEEFERLPDHIGKLELLRGEVIASEPIETRNHRIANRLLRRFDAAINSALARRESLRIGEIFRLAGYQMGSDSWLQPDLSLTHIEQPENKYLQGAPAIAIEVISSGDLAEDVVGKRQIYFEFGAAEVWRIYPETRHLEIYMVHSGQLFGANDSVTTPLLPGFSVSVTESLGA